MKNHILAYDFGTGGIKASMFTAAGVSVAESFVAYETHYPCPDFREQKPADWWRAFCTSTKELMEATQSLKNDIECLCISGHSLGVVPVDKDGLLLREYTPIWSDARAKVQADRYFETHSWQEWYERTGNGFPAHLYSIFKVLWYREVEPEMFRKIHKFLGTKDYINFLLTDKMCTDHSYASGSGFYNLTREDYEYAMLKELKVPAEIFPEIYPSTEIIGSVTKRAAEQTGLPKGLPVVCGGVDNACMALGAMCIEPGRAYTSLGSSAWIAVADVKPILDTDTSVFVFAHAIPHMFVSAQPVFSAGSSYLWVRDQLCKNLMQTASPYVEMEKLARSSPVGANKLLFNPSLAGGSGLDKTPNLRGAFLGLDLKHTQADIIRSTMEGIAMNLRIALDLLSCKTVLQQKMLIVGGGSKSNTWMEMFANVYQKTILKTNVGQNAGSLGAAAIGAVGCGMWKDFSMIDRIHEVVGEYTPRPAVQKQYDALLKLFVESSDYLCEIGDRLFELEL